MAWSWLPAPPELLPFHGREPMDVAALSSAALPSFSFLGVLGSLSQRSSGSSSARTLQASSAERCCSPAPCGLPREPCPERVGELWMSLGASVPLGTGGISAPSWRGSGCRWGLGACGPPGASQTGCFPENALMMYFNICEESSAEYKPRPCSFPAVFMACVFQSFHNNEPPSRYLFI